MERFIRKLEGHEAKKAKEDEHAKGLREAAERLELQAALKLAASTQAKSGGTAAAETKSAGQDRSNNMQADSNMKVMICLFLYSLFQPHLPSCSPACRSDLAS